MCRYINFRYDCYKTLLSIFHYFPNVSLRIVTAIGSFFFRLRRLKISKTTSTWDTPGTYFPQVGQTFDLNTPSLIIGQVPVEYIEFVLSHFINVLLYKFLGKEMTAYIQHQA